MCAWITSKFLPRFETPLAQFDTLIHQPRRQQARRGRCPSISWNFGEFCRVGQAEKKSK